ncbi:MAG TPA: ATP-binding protein [Candidatus Acidoferrales bacterium]|nr:ATP-binding protein [Candidatus Acidoferrales bacterium]
MTIELKNALSEVEALQRMLAEFGERHHLLENIVFDVTLALEEVLTNIISYAFDDDGEHKIRIRLSLDEGVLTAEVEDDGRPFDPLRVPAPELSSPLEKRPVGGLGIHLIRGLMDELEYRRVRGRNVLRLKKKAKVS